MRISDWSSDVCSSDLKVVLHHVERHRVGVARALLCGGVGQAGGATSSRQLTPTYRSAAACRHLYDTSTKNGSFGQIPGRPAFEVNHFQGTIQVAGATMSVVADAADIRAPLDGLLQFAGIQIGRSEGRESARQMA